MTRADLQLIGQGIMKLPYETAAPLLVELQKQLEAQTCTFGTTCSTTKPDAPVAKSETPPKK